MKGGGVPLHHDDTLVSNHDFASWDVSLSIGTFSNQGNAFPQECKCGFTHIKHQHFAYSHFWYQLHYSAITDTKKKWKREVIFKDLRYNQHN